MLSMGRPSLSPRPSLRLSIHPPLPRSLRTSGRRSTSARSADEAWAVLAGAGPGRHWYVDAAPFVVRGALEPQRDRSTADWLEALRARARKQP